MEEQPPDAGNQESRVAGRAFMAASATKDTRYTPKGVKFNPPQPIRKYKFWERNTEAQVADREKKTSPPLTSVVVADDVIITSISTQPDKHTTYGYDDGRESESEDEDEGNDNDSSIYGDDYDSSLGTIMERRLFDLPCTHGLIDQFRTGVSKNVVKQLRRMLLEEPTTELVLEIADSIDLLRLLGASNPLLDKIGKMSRQGATLYNQGMGKMSQGQELLRSVLGEIPSL